VPPGELSQDPLQFSWFPVILCVWLRHSLHSPPTQLIMKLFTEKFIQTLMFNVATIAAIVVGLCQFAVRAYNENNGNEKVRKVIQTVLQFVDTLIQHSKVFFADPVTVPVQQQSAKRAKVA
jgi:uncharacterized metal-binding protein